MAALLGAVKTVTTLQAHNHTYQDWWPRDGFCCSVVILMLHQPHHDALQSLEHTLVGVDLWRNRNQFYHSCDPLLLVYVEDYLSPV